MAETGPDDLDALAGEYVLGTLAPGERRAAVERLSRDAAFRGAVAAWELRLQPLADAALPKAPPAHLFERILGALPDPAISNIVALRRSVRRWRVGTALAGLIAASLLAVVVFDRTLAPKTTEYVATLTSDGKAPAFVLTVDIEKDTLTIRRVADAAPSDKSYELWAVPPGGAPKSLGVVENASYTRTLPYAPGDLVFAVSLEPKGGSTTGTPGEVVFSGPLISSQ